MMNGDLDPQTPLWVAQPAGTHLNGAHQYFFNVPRAAHAVLVNSPVATPGAEACGLQLLLDFLESPTTPPGAGCLTDTLPVDFAGDPQLAAYLFGVSNAWENPPSPPPPAPLPSALPQDLRRTLRWLRRHAPLLPGRIASPTDASGGR